MRLLRCICLVLTVLMSTCIVTPTAAVASPSDPTVYLKGHQLKVTKKAKSVSTAAKKGDVTPYIIILNGPVDESMKAQIVKTGAKLLEYLPDFAFLAAMTPEVVERVGMLPGVLDIQEYLPAYKIDPGLLDSNGHIKGEGEIVLNVSTFDGDLPGPELENIDGQRLGHYKNGVTVKINRNQIASLAGLSNVKYIEEKGEITLFNDLAKGIIQVDQLWNLGYEGEDQIIGISDTGIDTGVNDSTMHLDFQGRIEAIFSWSKPVPDDTHGHGTHVAGSVLGNGASSNGQIQGMAPKAHLVFQSISKSDGSLELPSDLNALFQQAWNAGARIHTNSWGNNLADFGKYTSYARQVDEFVWNHDMTILFSAGNNGPGECTVAAPGTAKNAITVGASNSGRPDIIWPNDPGSGDPTTIATFSSRGWTSDGRIKPDLVAPGRSILSTRSSKAPDTNFDAAASPDPHYAFMTGTSMATPITAGAVAIARQYIISNWGITPKPALLKAAVINGATDLGYGTPGKQQGWGRVNLVDSLQSKEYQFDQETSLLTGQTKTYTFSVAENLIPLRITLVWTDYPAAIAAEKTLVNDLDLTVIGPDGTEYRGNDFANRVEYDRVNNVENVWISTPQTGNYTVMVNGYNVPQGPQPFALFASANFGVPDIANDHIFPTCSLTSPAEGTLTGMVTVSANASDNIALSKVEFYLDSTLIGSDTTSPYSINWDTTKVANGSYHLRARAYDLATNITDSSPIPVQLNNQEGRTVEEHFAGKVNYYGNANAVYYIHVTDPGLIQLSLSWLNKADLDITLISPSGKEAAKATSTKNPETLTYNASELGLYKIQVIAFSGADEFLLTAAHDIHFTLTDQMEKTENVTSEIRSTHEITIGNTSGTINIEVSWNGTADLDVYLYDPSGKLVAKSFSNRNPETISYVIPADGAGIYRIQVDAYSGSATYTIQVFSPK